jgi:hypothetical protein
MVGPCGYDNKWAAKSTILCSVSFVVVEAVKVAKKYAKILLRFFGKIESDYCYLKLDAKMVQSTLMLE